MEAWPPYLSLKQGHPSHLQSFLWDQPRHLSYLNNSPNFPLPHPALRSHVGAMTGHPLPCFTPRFDLHPLVTFRIRPDNHTGGGICHGSLEKRDEGVSSTEATRTVSVRGAPAPPSSSWSLPAPQAKTGSGGSRYRLPDDDGLAGSRNNRGQVATLTQQKQGGRHHHNEREGLR